MGDKTTSASRGLILIGERSTCTYGAGGVGWNAGSANPWLGVGSGILDQTVEDGGGLLQGDGESSGRRAVIGAGGRGWCRGYVRM